MKSLGDLGNIFKQAQEMQKQMQKVQEEAGRQEVTAAAGGGLVTVTANGRLRITRIRIDKDVVNPEDIGMLEDLILVAVNEALVRAQELVSEKMNEIAGNLNLPIPGLG